MEEEIRDPRTEGVEGLKGLNRQTEGPKGLSVEPIRSLAPNRMSLKDYTTGQVLGDRNRGQIEYVGTEDYGESRYDDDISQLSELDDINETRAQLQPWYDQIGAGITKGAVLAGTTFADGIGGTIVGALNVINNIDKVINSDDALKEIGNQFINNPFSTYMQQINESVESALPNYYTKEEQESPWWDNIFTANFIGDKFLKNAGFMIGAAYSGKIASGALSKTMGLKNVRDAFKGTVTTASGRVLNTTDEIAKAYHTGDAFMDGVKLTEDLGKAAKKLKDAEWKLKTVGAVNAAMGEGRIEAISNSKEFFDYNKKLLDDNLKDSIDNIESELFNEHPEWFGLVDSGDGITKNTIIDPRGIEEWNIRKTALEDKYNAALTKLSEDRVSMANKVFMLNVPLLAGGNLWQYGKFLAGGYNTGRLSNKMITGSIKDGFKLNKAYGKADLARAISSPLAEAQEEMSQSMFSEITGQKYASELNDFYGAKINPDAEEETINWLNAIEKGFQNTYGSAQAWEEGFIGGLTGLIGIPSISMKKKDNGKKRPSISLGGELWQGIDEYKEERKDAQKIVNDLNSRIQSPEFLNYYQGTIRHNKYQNDMDAALAKGDNFEFKNAESSQLVSDAIMFKKAGRLQDLYDIIDEAGNVSQEDIEEIRSLTVDKETGKSLFEGKTDEEVRQHVLKQVQDTKAKLDRFSKISEDLKTLYGKDIDSDFLDEMTWKLTQIDDWESRTKDIINSIREPLQAKAEELNNRFGLDINVVLNNFNDFGRSFGEDRNLLLDIYDVINDKNLPIAEQRFRIETLIKEKEAAKKADILKLGRTVLNIKNKFKKRKDRIEKQRERFLNSMISTQEDTDRLQGARVMSLNDFDDFKLDNLIYMESLEKQIDALSNQFSVRARKKFANRKDVKENEETIAKLKDEISQIKQYLKGFRTPQDINEDFDTLMRSIENRMYLLSGKFNSDAVFDKRYKSGMIESNKYEESKLRTAARYESKKEAIDNKPVLETEEYNSLISQILALKEMLNSDDNKLVSPLEVRKINDSLLDLIKIHAVRNKFIEDYNTLSKSPQLFTEEVQKSINKAVENSKNKRKEELKDKLSKVTSVNDINEISKDYSPEVVDSALKDLSKSDNEELKGLVKDYNELETLSNTITDIIDNMEDDAIKASIVNITNSALEDAESSDDVIKDLNKAINEVPEEVAEVLENILDKVDRHKKSKKTTQKDDNKPKNPVKRGIRAFASSAEEAAKMDKASRDEEDSKSNEADEKKAERKERERVKKELEEAKSEEEFEKESDSKTNKFETPIILASDDEDSNEADTSYSDKVVEHLNDSNDAELEKVAKGEVVIDEYNKEEVQELAQTMLDNRSTSNKEEQSEGTNSMDNVAPKKEERRTPYLRSWVNTKYNFKDLSNKDIRRATLYDTPIVRALDDLGVFDFVDEGNLGLVFNKDENTPIYYVKVNDDRLSDVVVLAIEITDDIKDLVDTSKSFIGQDGKRYQAVGALGYDADIKESKRSYDTIKDLVNSEYSEYLNEGTEGQEEEIIDEDISKSTESEESFDVYNEEDRVKASKLLNKEDIIDARNTVDGDFEVYIKLKGDFPHLSGVITFNKERNRWEARVTRLSKYNHSDLSKEENEVLDNNLIDQETVKKIVDKYIPKDLQEYYNSGQYKKDNKELDEKISTPLLKKEGITTKQIAEANMKSPYGETQVLRDKWGIYFINEWTDENNYFPETESKKVSKPKKKVKSKSEESKKPKETPMFFISSRPNKIKHIYSGRMVKTKDENAPYQKPLSDITDETPIIAVYYNGDMHGAMLDKELEEYANLNSNNMNTREGSVWVFTREADGRYYAKSVKVKRFNSDEFDLDENSNTPIMKEIRQQIEILVKPISDFTDIDEANYIKSKAKFELMNLLHFNKFNDEDSLVFNITEDGNTIISVKGFRNNIGGELEGNAKVDAIIEALHSDELNLRFQIIPSLWSEDNRSYIKMVMDSNILTTDLAQLNNVNASFDLYTVDNEGKIIKGEEESKKGPGTPKHISNSTSYNSLYLNSKQYTIADREVKLEGKVITDSYTISELRLLYKIQQGIVSPVEGNDKLYLGLHDDGTEFGIIYVNNGGRVKTGSALELQKENAKKKVDKENKKKGIKKLADSDKSLAESIEFELMSSSKSSKKKLLKDLDEISEEVPEETKEAKESSESFMSSVNKSKATSLLEDLDEETSIEEGEVAEEESFDSSEVSNEEDELFEDIEKEGDEIIEKPIEESIEESKTPIVITDSYMTSNAKGITELESDSSEDFYSLSDDFLDEIDKLGFEDLDELKTFADEHKVSTLVTTKEQFKAMLETIKHCR